MIKGMFTRQDVDAICAPWIALCGKQEAQLTALQQAISARLDEGHNDTCWIEGIVCCSCGNDELRAALEGVEDE